MTRDETVGIGVALLGHAALLALLMVSLRQPPPALPQPKALEVSISEEVGLTSQAPNPSQEPPAEKKADELGPVTPDSAPPVPVPAPAAEPAKASTAAEKPTPLPTKRTPLPRPDITPSSATAANSAKTPIRPTGRLTPDMISGSSDSPSKSQSTNPQAATAGPQERSDIFSAIMRQVRPHWRSPTGADVEMLVTRVEVRLNSDGSLAAEPRVVDQTGGNSSNQPQQQLHKERAIAAIKQAAPFQGLPPEYYSVWSAFVLRFDRKLSS